MCLDGTHQGSIQAVVGVERLGRVAGEEEVAVDEREDDVADDLSDVHPADHLFKGLFARVDALSVEFVVVGRDTQDRTFVVERSPCTSPGVVWSDCTSIAAVVCDTGIEHLVLSATHIPC